MINRQIGIPGQEKLTSFHVLAASIAALGSHSHLSLATVNIVHRRMINNGLIRRINGYEEGVQGSR